MLYSGGVNDGVMVMVVIVIVVANVVMMVVMRTIGKDEGHGDFNDGGGTVDHDFAPILPLPDQ